MDDFSTILADFDLQEHFARNNGPISERSCKRYRDQPDGLPYLEWGGRIYIGPRSEARAWLMRRVRRPNPLRRKR
jgi:hypothetical protein